MMHAVFEMGGYVAMARRAHCEAVDALVAAFAKGAS